MTTAREIATAAGISPRTKRYVLRDRDGYAYDGRRYSHILCAIGRSDVTPALDSRVRTVAWALHKSMTSARMPAESENRLDGYSPYQLCAVVARIANECHQDTIGGICDDWLPSHHRDL